MSEEQLDLVAPFNILVGNVADDHVSNLDDEGDPLVRQGPPVAGDVASAVSTSTEVTRCWYCAFLTGQFRDKGPLHVCLETENFFHEKRQMGACLTSPALAQILYAEWVAKIYTPLTNAGVREIREYMMTAAKFEHCIQRETFAFHQNTRRVDRELEISALADHLFKNTTSTNEANETKLELRVIETYVKLITAQIRPSSAESSSEGWQPIKPGKRKRGF